MLKIILTILLIREISCSKFEQPALCTLCDCQNITTGTQMVRYRIECLNSWYIETLNTMPGIQLVFNLEYFHAVNKNLKALSIDMDHIYNEDLKITISPLTFSLMRNLKILSINKIANLNEIPNLESSQNLRELTVHKSNLKRLDPKFCTTKSKLVKLDLAYNELQHLGNYLDACFNLTLLDVSYNQLKNLDYVFGPNSALTTIQLNSNELKEIKSSDLCNLKNLQELSVANNQLKRIDETAFDQLENLEWLDLSQNSLNQLPRISKIYKQLKYLNVDGNKNLIYFPAAEQFNRLEELKVYYAYHCCSFLGKKIIEETNFELRKEVDQSDDHQLIGVHDEFALSKVAPKNYEYDVIEAVPYQETSNDLVKYTKLKCSPLPDAFMPCENLLEDFWLRLSVWIISFVGLIANFSVILYNFGNSCLYYTSTHDLNVPTYLMTNLAVADSLMSLYLAFIAVKDMQSRDKFGQSALEWQKSFGCPVAGFMGVVSSLTSALCLAFITFERYYSIKNSTDFNKRISSNSAILVSLIIWILSLILAAMPLVHLNLNSYDSYALCLPFDTRHLGDQIFLIIINTILTACFFFIFGCYLLIFLTTLLIERKTMQPHRTLEDRRLARNISLLVAVNLICWAPVVFICARALVMGGREPINRGHLKVVAVFVVPFNSLANPFLYCISRREFRMHVTTELVKYRFRRNLRTGSSFTSAKSSATSRTKNGSI